MNTRCRRIVLSALATAAVATATLTDVPSAEAATTYRVVMTGDSIAAMSYGYPAPGGQSANGGVWRNLEYGRNAYTVGMGGWGSTWAVAKLAISRVQADGWVVVQDNSLGATDWEWTKLLRDIVAATPDSVCLLGVLPGFLASVNAQHSATVARHAGIMKAEFERQPCSEFVYLNAYMRDRPAQFVDGQHPDATAQRWIKGSITAWTG